MKRLFLTLCLVLGSLTAKELQIHETFISAMSGPYQLSYEDPTHRLSAERIYHNTGLIPYPKLTASYSTNVYWSRFEIRNTGDHPSSIVIRNLRAGTDQIDVYLYRGDELSKTILLGDLRSQDDRLLLSPKSAFYVTVAPHETITVVSRFQTLGSYDLQWEVSSTSHYSFINSLELWFWGIYGGLTLALVLYNLMMYTHLKKGVFLAYVAHALFLLWFQYAYAGILYFLNIGIPLMPLTLSLWPVPYLMLTALGVFTLLFFEFHRTNRFIARLLTLIITLNLTVALILLYAFIDTRLLLYSNAFLLFSLVTLLIYFGIGVYALYRRYTGGWYYLIGEGSYIASLIYLSVVFAGKTPTGYLTYLVPIAILIEIFAFSMALGNRVKKLQTDYDMTLHARMDEARFISIGKSVGMAVHQWKDPLARLGSQLLYLKAQEYTGNLTKHDLSAHIEAMSELIEHMKESVNDVYESCTDIRSSRLFYLHESVDLAHRFLKDRLTLANVVLESTIPPTISAYGSKTALTNVLMTLIDNSIDQFESHPNNTNKSISISLTSTPQSLTLQIEDNGGGIAIRPISKIFEIDYSEKASQGAGIGLALVKILVEKRLSGTIDASNTADGALFQISLPNGQNQA